MNIFPPWTGLPGYPSPVSGASIPVATNSWITNALRSQIADQRVITSLPWYGFVNYDNETLAFGMCGCGIYNVIHSTLGGASDITVTEIPVPQIGVDTSRNLILSKYDDYSATFSFGGQGAQAYLVRGSPFINLAYKNQIANILFLNGTIQGSLTQLPNNVGITWQTQEYQANLTQQNLSPTISVATFQDINNSTVTITRLSSTQYSIVSPLFTTYTLDTTNSQTPFSPAPPAGDYQSTNDVYTLTIRQDNLTIIITISSIQVSIETKMIINRRWLLFSPVEFTIGADKQSLISSSVINGLVQIAYDGREGLASQFNILKQGVGNTVTSGIIENPVNVNNMWSYTINWTRYATSPILLYLPSNSTFFSKDNSLVPVTTKITLSTIPYGLLTLYTLTTNISVLTSTPLTIPMFPDLSILTPDQRSYLITLIQQHDVPTSVVNLSSAMDPYTYGQAAFRVARIILLAYLLKMDFTISYSGTTLLNLLTSLQTSLVPWLNGTLLKYESSWSGVIFPIGNSEDPTGNAFYNDHHFQYGYIIYAIAVIEFLAGQLGQNAPGLSLSAQYSNNILALMSDVCGSNNLYGSLPRVRHKDFVFGHSLATGIFNNISVDRQQESVSEAINCYHACWILSNILGNTDLSNWAGLSLVTEISAAIVYYRMYGAGVKTDIWENLTCSSVQFSLGRGYTSEPLVLPSVPEIYPDRNLGLVSIISLPFTEISPLHVIPTLGTFPVNWPSIIAITKLPYGITADNLRNSTNYPWVADALMILAVTSMTTDADINVIWKTLLGKRLNSVDSFSNTALWLMNRGRLALPFLLSTETYDLIDRRGNGANIPLKIVPNATSTDVAAIDFTYAGTQHHVSFNQGLGNVENINQAAAKMALLTLALGRSVGIEMLAHSQQQQAINIISNSPITAPYLDAISASTS